MSLYTLEHRVIRKRFADPRVHFALNCAARGCPRLPGRAFAGDRLDVELDAEARKFVDEPRNVVVDPFTQSIFLSSIFKWYKADFLRWQERLAPTERATLVSYVTSYLPPEKAAAMRACQGCRVRFVPYDWRLNDQNAPG